jgi:hypothetical protein
VPAQLRQPDAATHPVDDVLERYRALFSLPTRNGSGDFVLSDIWGVGGQSLGIAVSPDQRVLAAGGADAQTGVEGFHFIPL